MGQDKIQLHPKVQKMKPIKKSNPNHPSYKPPTPVGEFTRELCNSQFGWLFHHKFRLVVAVRFTQSETYWSNIAIILEDGSEIPCTKTGKGLHPLMKTTPNVIPGDVTATSCKLSTFPPHKATPGGFFWTALDCGMEKDPLRAVIAKSIADFGDGDHWTVYDIYTSPLKTDVLKDIKSWDEYQSILGKKVAHDDRSRCSKPAGTDGWR